MSRILSAVVICIGSSFALAQQQPTAEQYQDALNQLRQLQNDKSELATKHRELQKRIAELEQQRLDTAMRLETLENRVYYLREHYAAWQSFLEQNPPLRVMWFSYFMSGEFQENVIDLLGDRRWPFNVEG